MKERWRTFSFASRFVEQQRPAEFWRGTDLRELFPANFCE